jgi:hypothetical protein
MCETYCTLHQDSGSLDTEDNYDEKVNENATDPREKIRYEFYGHRERKNEKEKHDEGQTSTSSSPEEALYNYLYSGDVDFGTFSLGGAYYSPQALGGGFSLQLTSTGLYLTESAGFGTPGPSVTFSYSDNCQTPGTSLSGQITVGLSSTLSLSNSSDGPSLSSSFDISIPRQVQISM